MTLVVPSRKVLEDLKSLPAEVRRCVRWHDHESGGILLSSWSRAADDWVRAMREKWGQTLWSHGRYHVERAQLRFPGF